MAGGVDGGSSGGGGGGGGNGADAGGNPLGSACDALDNPFMCESFDDATLDGMFRNEQSGTVQVSTDIAYRGEGALHASTSPGDGSFSQASAGRFALPSISSGTLNARAYVLLPSGVEVENLVFLALSQTEAPYENVQVALGDGGFLRLDNRVAEITEASTFQLPRDEWTCVELEIEVGAIGSVAVRANGSTQIFASQVDTLPEGTYQKAAAGINWAPQTQPQAELFIDEFIVSTQPIGCDE